MPKFYCDYCDVFLTNDSISVRKLHYKGWKHKTNVRAFYAQFVDDPTSALMVSTQTNNTANQAASNPNILVMNPLLSTTTTTNTSASKPNGVPIQQQQPVLASGMGQPIMMMGVPLIMIPSNTALLPQQQPATGSVSMATTATTSSATTSALTTTTRQSMEQMIKTPELASPPFVPDVQDEIMEDAATKNRVERESTTTTSSSLHHHHHEYPPFIASELCQHHHEMPRTTSTSQVSTSINVPPLFLFPPPPPPHLVNLCPEIPLTGSYQQYAPSPPFPFVLQKQQQHMKM
ncbi:hypothetical protein C9374_007854 [Naegleria lovaniensis]|uniref:Matrin-type domain-containing protein n=1 Tax=Naegleria lovaniensis TaxID=51637 RepID=A0AA88GK68_NAELO|nr:uncharacterized protein C9374_007854 [Naegleria lovaniensis]KAG2378706.1 hypothetical protein C9374_007854 [Naegleria lovaniensis]